MTSASPSINGRPTKEFFLTMLVRDIELAPAIVDLVDNCVDGARRLRSDQSYGGLAVHLHLSTTEFSIRDNCGGIPLDDALNYAFRFGRPADAPETEHSVGQFGVGMKRAVFKLGRRIIIDSVCADSTFRVDIDVEKWRTIEPWEFEFTSLDDGNADADSWGTTIEVTELTQPAARALGQETFRQRLAADIAAKHHAAMRRGLEISINGVPVKFRAMEILQSEHLKPGHDSRLIEEGLPVPVSVETWVGLSESEPNDAGWHVFCNGRMVLSADKTSLTGWGLDDEGAIPRYHNRYARFRGYVFFDSKDSSLLPWTTTKIGVDEDSWIYRQTRQHMAALAAPVLEFLRRVEKETEAKLVSEDAGPLQTSLEEAEAVPLEDADRSGPFVRPDDRPPPPSPPDTGNISYRRPLKQIERAQKVLGVTTYYEVGQRTFDYFYEAECSDEDDG